MKAVLAFVAVLVVPQPSTGAAQAEDLYGTRAGLFAASPENGDLWRHTSTPMQRQKVVGPGKSFAAGNRVVGLSPDGSAVFAFPPARTWVKVGDAAARVFAGGNPVCAMSPGTYEVFCLDLMRVGW